MASRLMFLCDFLSKHVHCLCWCSCRSQGQVCAVFSRRPAGRRHLRVVVGQRLPDGYSLSTSSPAARSRRSAGVVEDSPRSSRPRAAADVARRGRQLRRQRSRQHSSSAVRLAGAVPASGPAPAARGEAPSEPVRGGPARDADLSARPRPHTAQRQSSVCARRVAAREPAAGPRSAAAESRSGGGWRTAAACRRVHAGLRQHRARGKPDLGATAGAARVRRDSVGTRRVSAGGGQPRLGPLRVRRQPVDHCVHHYGRCVRVAGVDARRRPGGTAPAGWRRVPGAAAAAGAGRRRAAVGPAAASGRDCDVDAVFFEPLPPGHVPHSRQTGQNSSATAPAASSALRLIAMSVRVT